MLETTSKTDLQNLLEESREHDTHKTDYKQDAKSFSFDNDANMAIPENMMGALNVQYPPMPQTDWALRQICQKLGKSVFGGQKTLPFDYIKAMRPNLRAYVLNHHVSNSDNLGTWLVRAYDTEVRAVLSDRYAPISNTELLEMLNQIAESSNAPHSVTKSSSVRPDDLNIKIIWKNIVKPKPDKGGNDNWGVGVYIGNGEIGNRKLRVRPLIQRHSCQNSIIGNSDLSSLEITHIGNPRAKLNLLKSVMVEALPFAAQLLEDMIAADDKELPEISKVLYILSKQYNWSQDIYSKTLIGTEGNQSIAGVVNGITYAAQSITNPNDRVDMEELGGAILLDKDSVFTRVLKAALK